MVNNKIFKRILREESILNVAYICSRRPRYQNDVGTSH